ncbi:gamma carbonic anhydrase family protein [Nocardioides litoris]|uniref:gamma carbonic anhydrase family protein n=1 Tax=Nocardioides litoris TaxID=1926648 RepID=UPI0011214631|nr:gamma carbonic anhydrase family protein [Nocardioides litoris]
MSAERHLGLGGRHPRIHPGAWVAPDAWVLGDVHVGDGAGLWYGVVARADTERIEVGEHTNVQDGVVLHADPGYPLVLGRGVSVGHRAVLHGASIGDDVLVGMGAIVMNGAVVGPGSVVGAGAVVAEGVVVEPRSLVLGLPGRVRRATTDDEVAATRLNAERYRRRAAEHRAALDGTAGAPAPRAAGDG